MNTLEVNGLEKKYKDFTLENITLVLPKGFICGYVGQNGAGKEEDKRLFKRNVYSAYVCRSSCKGYKVTYSG